MQNKKGLSDVVTTVLIILLVVAAVAAVWAFIQPTLKGTGTAIDKGTVCFTNSVNPVSCVRVMYNATATNHTVGYTASFDDKVVGINSLTATFKLVDGSVFMNSSLGTVANAESKSSRTIINTNATSVSITAVYNLASGTTTCTSTELACA